MEAKHKLSDLTSITSLGADDIIQLVDEGVLKTTVESAEESEWFFQDDAVNKLKNIDNLVSMGYSFKTAIKIVKNVGLPEKTNDSGRARAKKPLFTPGDLAKLFNVSPRAIKYWEEKELIKPYNRSKSGMRFYHKKTKIEIILLKSFQSLGFSLDEIKVFLDLYNSLIDNGDNVLEPEKIRYFLSHLDDLDKKLEEYETSVNSLKKLSGKGRSKLMILQKR